MSNVRLLNSQTLWRHFHSLTTMIQWWWLIGHAYRQNWGVTSTPVISPQREAHPRHYQQEGHLFNRFRSVVLTNAPSWCMVASLNARKIWLYPRRHDRGTCWKYSRVSPILRKHATLHTTTHSCAECCKTRFCTCDGVLQTGYFNYYHYRVRVAEQSVDVHFFSRLPASLSLCRATGNWIL